MRLRPLVRIARLAAAMLTAAAAVPAHGQDINRLEQIERERPGRMSRYEGFDRYRNLERYDHDAYHGRFDRYDRFRRDWRITRPYSYRNRNYHRYRLGLYHRQLHLGTGTDGVYYYNYGPGGGIAY